jgi:hypothetical protein
MLGAPAALVYALAASAATAVTLTRPAQNGLLPLLAGTPDALSAANAALGTIENASILVAPAVASVLLAFAGPGLVYAVMAAALALSAIVVARVRTPTSAAGLLALDEPVHGPTQALRVLASDPRRSRSSCCLPASAAGRRPRCPFRGACAQRARDRRCRCRVLNAALGLGGIVGALSAAALAGRTTLTRWVAFGILLWGGGLAAIALLPSVAVVFALIAGAGAGRSLMDVAGRTLLQRVAPAAVLSSVFGVLEGLTMAALALGAALAPVLVQDIRHSGSARHDRRAAADPPRRHAANALASRGDDSRVNAAARPSSRRADLLAAAGSDTRADGG